MTQFKLELWHIIAIGLIIALATGIITFGPGGIYWGGEEEQEEQEEQQQQRGLEIVTKTIKFVFLDKYAGSAPSGTGAYLYDSTGKTQLEGSSSSISSGTWTTSNPYQSDTKLVLKYVYDTTNDDIYWCTFTVPRMTSADAQSLTTNAITINVFNLPTLTDTLYDSAGNSYADNGDWNKTSGGKPGSATSTATYSWYVSSDNKGYLESKDPQYNINLKAALWAKVSGTNYENVILTGWEGAYEKGSAMYYYKVLDPTTLTKYKVGQEYVYSGAGSFSWTVDLTGYSNSTTPAIMQIYLYVYCDPVYHQSYGSFGPYAVQLAEQTIDLTEGDLT